MTDAEREAQIRQRSIEGFDRTSVEPGITHARLDRVELLRLLDEARARVNSQRSGIESLAKNLDGAWERAIAAEAETRRLQADADRGVHTMRQQAETIRGQQREIARLTAEADHFAEHLLKLQEEHNVLTSKHNVLTASPGASAMERAMTVRNAFLDKCTATGSTPYSNPQVVHEEIARAIEQAEREARAAAIEEAAQWHDAEAKRIGALAAEPRNVCIENKMYEAADEHENCAIFIRALADREPKGRPDVTCPYDHRPCRRPRCAVCPVRRMIDAQ